MGFIFMNNTVQSSTLLLPLVLQGKITHDEADTIAAAVKYQKIPDTTRGILIQFGNVIGRDLINEKPKFSWKTKKKK